MSNILVVEDNASNLQLVQFILEGAGHCIHAARDAEAALLFAATEPVDLVLMDIHLPGMDGLEATRQLKQDQHTAHIPVIALTALAMTGDEARTRAAGCDGYLAKPFPYRALLALVALHLKAA
jgi:two-component system cell cycle response regulator DivK